MSFCLLLIMASAATEPAVLGLVSAQGLDRLEGGRVVTLECRVAADARDADRARQLLCRIVDETVTGGPSDESSPAKRPGSDLADPFESPPMASAATVANSTSHGSAPNTPPPDPNRLLDPFPESPSDVEPE